jgi:hypothetical protein
MVYDERATVQYTISLEQMEELYQAIRREDPTRPQLNVWSQLPTCSQFADMFSEENTPLGRPPWMDESGAYEGALGWCRFALVLVDGYPSARGGRITTAWLKWTSR